MTFFHHVLMWRDNDGKIKAKMQKNKKYTRENVLRIRL